MGIPATDLIGSQRFVSGGFTSPSILARQTVEGLYFALTLSSLSPSSPPVGRFEKRNSFTGGQMMWQLMLKSNLTWDAILTLTELVGDTQWLDLN